VTDEFDVTPEWDKSKGPKPREVELPSLSTAAELLGTEESLDDIPKEIDPDEELPPEPSFLIVRNAFGPGAHSVKFPDGTPVGVWASESGLDGQGIRDRLTNLGLDADLVDFFARNRDGAIAASAEIARDPVVGAFASEEERRRAAKVEIQTAFIKAWKEKNKK